MPRKTDFESRDQIANIYDVVDRSSGFTLENVAGGPDFDAFDLHHDELRPSLRENPLFAKKALKSLRDACFYRNLREERGARTRRVAGSSDSTARWVDRAHEAASLLVRTVPASAKSFETVALRNLP